jgi:dipeptidyl-peptidase-4
MSHAALGLSPQVRRWLIICLALLAGPTLVRADAQRVMGANYKQGYKYSPAFLQQYLYSTSVSPSWIGKTDAFWYEFRTIKGKQWYRVSPKDALKEPLFDRVKLAAQLSELTKKPLDPLLLPITSVSLNDEASKLKFVTEGFQYEFDLRAEKLTKLGKAATGGPGGILGDPKKLEQLRQQLGEEKFREFMERFGKGKEKQEKKDEQKDDGEDDELLRELLEEIDPQKGQPKGGVKTGDYKNFSPDKKLYSFVWNYNLYVAEPDKESEATQLSTDGAQDYTFAAGGGFGFGGVQQQTDDKLKYNKTRAPVVWAKDSKAFYVLRSDARGIKDLFLVNSVANPRPTLLKYKYAMPGDENVRKSELHVFHKSKNKLARIERKWKDEAYTDLHWGKSADELRFTRRDRVFRNIEFCTHHLVSGDSKCLIADGFENSMIVTQPMKYLDDSEEMIWWSERSGWGHFYLYDRSGKLKNAITAGDFRASGIVALDAKKRLLFFRANAREPGENVYFNHLYCVRFDGTGLTLLDPGDAHHNSVLSPTRQYVVDNCSRIDQAPVSVLRDARGNKIMDLEKADLARLHEVGWKLPETFVVKAADGVTDLYGNMWKPFDFDPKKKYPIIAHVYPGPQTESMQHSFVSVSPQQQLAQLGFIVIQVGNRGGSPLRSKAYQSHSYWNMRDYGLADKKTAIEQLCARHAWMDMERVGIYGHSGGGFMSAAAMLVPPYNDFFKAAVASAGNHDNNVYNNTWAERYHGMKEVPVKADDKKKETTPPKKTKGKLPPATGDDDDQVDDKKTGEKKEDDKKTDDKSKGKDDKKDDKTAKKNETRWDIRVPTNPELAANLKGRLLLVHGDMDNNVHPAHTIRLADALIKANKRFDMLILPGKAHGFADYQPYFTQRMWEFFAEHLLGDRTVGADVYERKR